MQEAFGLSRDLSLMPEAERLVMWLPDAISVPLRFGYVLRKQSQLSMHTFTLRISIRYSTQYTGIIL